MSLFSKIKGVLVAAFQIDAANAGPLLKNTGGILEIRNEDDNAYAVIRGDTPVAPNDLVTKTYADSIIAGTGLMPYRASAIVGGLIPDGFSVIACGSFELDDQIDLQGRFCL